ncbi:MAG: Swt1 family HEPN domain-containing protein [Nitrososphaeraceae archaeon]
MWVLQKGIRIRFAKVFWRQFFKTEMTLQISQVTKKGKEKENGNRSYAELERKIDSLIESLSKPYFNKILRALVNRNFDNAELRKIKNEPIWPWYEKKVENNLISYLDFNDYLKIIIRRNNWNEIFKDIFGDAELISAKFKELSPMRNAIAHMRDLEKEEIDRLRINANDILICVKKAL